MKDAGVISVIAMSEALGRTYQKRFRAYFWMPRGIAFTPTLRTVCLHNRRATSENDFLANLASYHIEILDVNENIPVKEGQTGRIVITDLFNKAMPMVRYDTGDLGVMGKSENEGKMCYVLKKVEGRKMDVIYDTKGQPISSFTITNNMWKYTELAQYQFIQTDVKQYEFRLNFEREFQERRRTDLKSSRDI